MDALTRRRFLRASAVTGASVLAAGAAVGLAEFLGTAGLSTMGGGRRTGQLVLVTLYGGNDGLNTVIPYADPAYQAARPELAYPPDQVLRLDDRLGLNPVLRGLKRLWDNRRLAVVLGVGYPKPDRSHFRSMDIWQTASPAGPVSTGWVGRWLDGTEAARFAAVSFEPVLPPLLVGRNRVGACVSYRGLSLPSWIDRNLVAALGRGQPNEPDMQTRAASAYTELIQLDRLVGENRTMTSAEAVDPSDATSTATGGENGLATQLDLVAHSLEVGVPTQVYSVSLGGFDTHANERSGQEVLLRQLDEALAGFADRLERSVAGRRTVVVVYSEFGRRVRANASDGTDHGTAGPVFVLGPRVAGGFYGAQPSLTDLDDGDLKATTDFRDVFGTMLASVLRAEPARYLGGYQPTVLPLVPGD